MSEREKSLWSAGRAGLEPWFGRRELESLCTSECSTATREKWMHLACGHSAPPAAAARCGTTAGTAAASPPSINVLVPLPPQCLMTLVTIIGTLVLLLALAVDCSGRQLLENVRTPLALQHVSSPANCTATPIGTCITEGLMAVCWNYNDCGYGRELVSTRLLDDGMNPCVDWQFRYGEWQRCMPAPPLPQGLARSLPTLWGQLQDLQCPSPLQRGECCKISAKGGWPSPQLISSC